MIIQNRERVRDIKDSVGRLTYLIGVTEGKKDGMEQKQNRSKNLVAKSPELMKDINPKIQDD